MLILVLCREPHRYKETRGLLTAFCRRNVNMAGVPDGTPFNADLRDLLKLCPERPSLILQPEAAFPLLPRGLMDSQIPTACFQVDTYAYARRRIRWSMLFDYAIVFHPGFEERFRAAGHPRPVTLYHAARRELYEQPEEERVLEVGWVGSIEGASYEIRKSVLRDLDQNFRMNDWRRLHSPEELAEVYRRSKIVVNVGRDDFPQDANMRVFEAMAGGALLLTQVPSELSAIGFEEGVHFVGYCKPEEVVPLVRIYLGEEAARRPIAEAGREKVLRQHTYDARAGAILRTLERDSGRQFAPARAWPEEEIRSAYLDYYAAHQCMDCAYAEWRRIAQLSLSHAIPGAALIAGAWSRRLRGQVIARVAGRLKSASASYPAARITRG